MATTHPAHQSARHVHGKGRTTETETGIHLPARSTSSAAGTSSSGSGLKWLSPIGPAKSCLHGVYGEPAPSAKVAFYDLDGTIVRPKGGKTFPSKTDEYDFEFLFSSPRAGLGGASSDRSVVARIRQQHAQQFAIVLITNQKQTAYSAKNGLVTWKKKMAHIAAAIDVPMRVFAALGDDAYRKPRLGSWVEFTERWNGGVEVDRESSFFVGDAAGGSKYRDHQDTDLKWALNARISFFTPEEYFLGKDKEYEVPARPWSPSALKPGPSLKGLVALPEDEMVSVDLSDRRDGKDGRCIVLGDGARVGPRSCCSSARLRRARRFCSARVCTPHYVHVNQDALRTRDKCLRVVADTIAAGQSCVVDNTNRDRATRKHYIELARQTGARIRCVYFDVPKHVCVHNNHFRAHHGPAADTSQSGRSCPSLRSTAGSSRSSHLVGQRGSMLMSCASLGAFTARMMCRPSTICTTTSVSTWGNILILIHTALIACPQHWMRERGGGLRSGRWLVRRHADRILQPRRACRRRCGLSESPAPSELEPAPAGDELDLVAHFFELVHHVLADALFEVHFAGGAFWAMPCLRRCRSAGRRARPAR